MKKAMIVYTFAVGYFHSMVYAWDFMAEECFETHEKVMVWLEKTSSLEKIGGKLAYWLLKELYDVEKYNVLPREEALEIARSMEELGDAFLVEATEMSKEAAIRLGQAYDFDYVTCMYIIHCSALDKLIQQFDLLFEQLTKQAPILSETYFKQRHKWRDLTNFLRAELASHKQDVERSGRAYEYWIDIEEVAEELTTRWRSAIDESTASYEKS